MHVIKQRAFAFLATLMLALGLGAVGGSVAVPSASAAGYGWVYVVVGNWHCTNGGKVVQLSLANGSTWSGGDAGDNILYPKVILGQRNTLNGWGWCNGRVPMYFNIVDFSFTPTANNQTFWW